MKAGNPSIQIIRADGPPNTDEAAAERWHRELGQLMSELRHVAQKTAGRRGPGARLLEAVSDGADAISGALVEHLWEFAAFHVPGPAGKTVAECAVRAARHLPHSLQRRLSAMSDSYWDLYEIEAKRDDGALRLRRIHDDSILAVAAVERRQPFVRGSVAAFRLFDAGGFLAAPVALIPEPDGIGGLVSRLELEWKGSQRFDRWSDYMRYRGSALIAGHAIARRKQRVVAGRQMPEPQVSLRESPLDVDDWRRLGEAFSLVERAAGDIEHGAPLVVDVQGEGAFLLDARRPMTSAMLFESSRDADTWRSMGRESGAWQPVPFVRLWRARPDALFAEDVDWLAKGGVDVAEKGVVVAVCLDEAGHWQDLDRDELERLVEVCRRVALRLSAADERAA